MVRIDITKGMIPISLSNSDLMTFNTKIEDKNHQISQELLEHFHLVRFRL